MHRIHLMQNGTWRSRLRLLMSRPVFVPLQAGRIDAGDVGAAVFVEVDYGACGGAHTAIVQVAACPSLGGGVEAVEIDAARLAAEAGDDFVHAVAVEVGGLDGVAVNQGGVDDFALPLRAALGVDGDLIAVSGFDGNQKSSLLFIHS